MAISRPPARPQVKPGDPVQINEEKVKGIISRGGSVAQDVTAAPPAEEDLLKSVQLRIYQSMIDDIDLQRGQIKKGKKPSRHAWIVSAIEDKLARQRET